jgi:Zn-dependent peptidase ImmA (M78 family)
LGVRADHALSHRRLEEFAAHVRAQLGFGTDTAINLLTLFEDLHEITIRRSDGRTIPLWGHVSDLESSEGYARYDKERNVMEIVVSTQTYDWLRHGHPRAAYCIGHELGHCLLHTDQLIRLAKMPTNQQTAFHRGQTTHAIFCDTEWQANAFSGALLMPAPGIAAIETRNCAVTPSMLANQFGVSREAAGYRLQLFHLRRSELLRK